MKNVSTSSHVMTSSQWIAQVYGSMGMNVEVKRWHFCFIFERYWGCFLAQN
jgi:hypothetical protein